MGWIAKYYDNVAEASTDAITVEFIQFSNRELLLIEYALLVAKEESGYFIGPGEWLYEKVRGHLESQGYRFNEDGSYYRITKDTFKVK
ncbi:hypothetical protein M2277_005690 [Paenibacillus sp. LBL]|uniref:hypothetical protein n=1 Tax=Paenibacillus sp. LBL TaxID=2940563 RepID=UPI002475B73A|nr:hypothetical protein [Paenibacillus sp. LBL]MDH6674991.1 hypothetical protein [Paenibacillus sp. LBL]